MEWQKFESSRLDQLRAKLRLKDRWVSQTDLTLDHKRRAAMSFIITWPTWYLHDSYGSHGCSSIPSVSPAFGEVVAPKGPRAETWATGEHSYTTQKNTESLLVWTLTCLDGIFVDHFLIVKIFPLGSWTWQFCCRLVEATFWIRCFVRSHKPGRATLFFEGLTSRSLCLWKSCLESHIFGTTSPKKSMAKGSERTLTLNCPSNMVECLAHTAKKWTHTHTHTHTPLEARG